MVTPDRRSWALGLAGAVGGFGQFAMVPMAQGLINSLSWSGALVALAVVCAMFLLLALPMRESASPAPVLGANQTMREALMEAFRHRGFWLLNLGFLACGFQLAFIASHLPNQIKPIAAQKR